MDSEQYISAVERSLWYLRLALDENAGPLALLALFAAAFGAAAVVACQLGARKKTSTQKEKPK